MEQKTKYKHFLGIIAIILFLIGLIILISGISYPSENVQYKGLATIFAILVAAIPIYISGGLAIIDVCCYFSKKKAYKCNKFFLVTDFIIIVITILPSIYAQIRIGFEFGL